MTALVHITSKAQFSSLLSSSSIVVADCELYYLRSPTETTPRKTQPNTFGPWLHAPSSTRSCSHIWHVLFSRFAVYADWCGPCKAIAPVYEQLARQLSRANKITFTKINVDYQQDVAKTYGVTAYVISFFVFIYFFFFFFFFVDFWLQVSC